MVAPLDAILPFPADYSTSDKLAGLSSLKHGLIGQTSRKLAVLRAGGADSLVKLVSELGEATSDSVVLCIEAATILGAISLPTAETVSILLEAAAYKALLHALTRIACAPVDNSYPFKLLETILRSLKALYIDLVKVCGPRAWGTDVIGVTVRVDERQDVGINLDLPSNASGDDGPESVDMEIEGVGETELIRARFEAKAERAIKDVYEMEETTRASSTFSTSKLVAPDALAFLQSLLIECASLNSAEKSSAAKRVPVASRMRVGDMICCFLAGTVRLQYQRQAAIGDLGSEAGVLWALRRFVVLGNGKVQEAALQALSALCRDYRSAAIAFNAIDRVQPPASDSSISNPTAELTRSAIPSLRLAAVTLQVLLYKTVHGSRPSRSVEYLVPLLIRLIESEPTLRANASFTLAYLLADNVSLQGIAIQADCLEYVRMVLHHPGRIDQPYQTTASLEASSRVSEGALLIVASMSAIDDEHRSQVLSAQLLQCITHSLTHSSAGVRAAACHCIRGLARSVSVLRTSLIDAGAVKAIYDLMRDEEDLMVQITVTAAISNLILEFSPVRQSLLDMGCIARLCALARSPNHTLKYNALYALKNACYQSKSSFKRATMEAIGWDNLGTMISGPSEEIRLEALSILRNVVFTSNNSQSITGLREMGEEKMLSLLETSMATGSDAVIEQAIYTIVNLSVGDESAKLAIVARNDLLRVMISLFSHTKSKIRSGAVWIVINLAYRGDHNSSAHTRQPIEIVAKLRAFGVEAKLRTMVDDKTLDVRERVRGALKALAAVPTPAL